MGTSSVVFAMIALPSACLLGLAVLTGLGARRRGQRILPAVAAGVFFPITWVVWYVRDGGDQYPSLP